VATIIKSGARKPLVADGAICAETAVRWTPSDTPGFVRGTSFIAITVHDPATRADYRLEMNSVEALQIISQLAEQVLATAPKEGE
jgi:hypothetical protein